MSICEDYSTAVQVRDRYNVFHHGGEDPKFLGSDPVSGHCYFLLNLISFHRATRKGFPLDRKTDTHTNTHAHTYLCTCTEREREYEITNQVQISPLPT